MSWSDPDETAAKCSKNGDEDLGINAENRENRRYLISLNLKVRAPELVPHAQDSRNETFGT